VEVAAPPHHLLAFVDLRWGSPAGLEQLQEHTLRGPDDNKKDELFFSEATAGMFF
jgi:hypothetical protein